MTTPDQPVLEVQRLVRAAMHQAQPSARARSRSQSHLLARLQAPPPLPPGSDASPAEPSSNPAPAMGTAALALKAAAAVLVAAGLTTAVARGVADQDPAPASAPPRVAVVSPDLTPTAALAPEPPAPALTPTPTVSPASSVSGRALASRTTSARKRVVPDVEASPAPAPGLSEEARLVARADAALVRGDARSARALLRSHKLQFPDGQLARERDGLLHVAACQLGEPGAQLAAQAFIVRNRDAGPVQRVADQCKDPSQ